MLALSPSVTLYGPEFHSLQFSILLLLFRSYLEFLLIFRNGEYLFSLYPCTVILFLSIHDIIIILLHFLFLYLTMKRNYIILHYII